MDPRTRGGPGSPSQALLRRRAALPARPASGAGSFLSSVAAYLRCTSRGVRPWMPEVQPTRNSSRWTGLNPRFRKRRRCVGTGTRQTSVVPAPLRRQWRGPGPWPGLSASWRLAVALERRAGPGPTRSRYTPAATTGRMHASRRCPSAPAPAPRPGTGAGSGAGPAARRPRTVPGPPHRSRRSPPEPQAPAARPRRRQWSAAAQPRRGCSPRCLAAGSGRATGPDPAAVRRPGGTARRTPRASVHFAHLHAQPGRRAARGYLDKRPMWSNCSAREGRVDGTLELGRPAVAQPLEDSLGGLAVDLLRDRCPR